MSIKKVELGLKDVIYVMVDGVEHRVSRCEKNGIKIGKPHQEEFEYLHEVFVNMGKGILTTAHLISFWGDIEVVLRNMKGAYHNINHVYKMVKGLQKLPMTELPAESRFELLVAILFHDAEPTESESMVVFNNIAQNYELPYVMYSNILGNIASTILGYRPRTRSNKYIQDLDLLILGASATDYDTYVEQVTKEYSEYDEYDFLRGRLHVLKSFISRDKIYHYLTDLEGQARWNIEREMVEINRRLYEYR